MNYFIRSATEHDLKQMFIISAKAHQVNYGSLVPSHRRDDFDRRYAINAENEQHYVNVLEKRLADDAWRIWVADVEGRVVGYTLAHKINDELLHKRGLFVEPEYQNQGIGKALFEISLDAAYEGIVELQVLEGNTRARHIYKKYGFKDVGFSDSSFFGARKVVMQFQNAHAS